MEPGRLEVHFSLTVLDDYAVNPWKERKTLTGQAAHPKPSENRADKFAAQSHPENTPMSCTSQTAQEQRPANLTALHQKLQELAIRTKSSVPKPVVAQGLVMVIKGK